MAILSGVRSFVPLVAFVALVAAAGLFGAGFEPGEWYADLEKPPLNPPDWVFPPVWSLLYLAIAVAAWLVWREHPESAAPLALWACQLVLNSAWSLLFFGLHRPGLALAEIVVLFLLVALTTRCFFRVRPLAGALLAPYLAWVGFAVYLNAGLWYLNR